MADQDVRTWNPAEHDAECEIENGAVGFDGIVCLCADRRKADAVIFVRSATTLPGWQFYLALGILVGFVGGFLLGLWLGVIS